jgi:hypothetical protein
MLAPDASALFLLCLCGVAYACAGSAGYLVVGATLAPAASECDMWFGTWFATGAEATLLVDTQRFLVSQAVVVEAGCQLPWAFKFILLVSSFWFSASFWL